MTIMCTILELNPPPLPPYYTKEFFKEISEVEEKGFNTSAMKIKDWYNLLIKKYVTHQESNNDYVLIPTRLEILHPHINHTNSFINKRKMGLPSRIMSSLFK